MRFNLEDIIKLREMSEEELCRLNVMLIYIANEIKRMYNYSMAYEAVKVAETAAEEVARRKHWSPIPSNGRYSINGGITYDTKEYRKWIRDNRKTKFDLQEISDSEALLSEFSFGQRSLILLFN